MRPVSVPCGTTVRVYRNLRNGLWSIQHKGLVVGHASHVGLRDVTPIIQPAGQARVRREGRKHVHAFLQGTLEWWQQMPADPIEDEYGSRVSYNPYVNDTFVVEGWAVRSSRRAQLTPYGAWLQGPTLVPVLVRGYDWEGERARSDDRFRCLTREDAAPS